jgi:xanthine dehydrogenase YagR molybdenum-binding subunit
MSRLAYTGPASTLVFPGAVRDDMLAGDGRLMLARRNLQITYTELLARNGLATLVGDGDYDPVEEANGPKAVFSFAAVFAEVRVDPDLGLVRLNRFVGAYDAGRIVNPKTARSQAIGGIIWGVGQALLEQSETDPVLCRFLHRNYSGYLVPTNADIPNLETLFVGEFDEEASPLGAKGLGELTAVSVAPAIANAVYHATGKRVRDLPITVEKVL